MPAINKLAILSGALGATASLIAKLALSPDSPIPTFIQSSCHQLLSYNVEIMDIHVCTIIAFASRGICLLLMIGVNAVMISSFLDGMNESGSVAGTSLSTAANFSCSVSIYVLDGSIGYICREIYTSTFFLRVLLCSFPLILCNVF